MKINLLTIGILTCDNDADKLAGYIDKVEERVHIPHEVIVWDNTETKTLPPLPSFVRVLQAGAWKENVRQFDARKGIVQAAKGDYVWFIDPDDDFAVIDKDFSAKVKDAVDIIVFDFIRSREKIAFTPSNKAKTVSWKNGFRNIGLDGALWNKWIRASALQKAYSLQKFPTRISFIEDALVCMLLLREPCTVWYAARQIYTYDAKASLGGVKAISSGEEMKRYCTGARMALSMIQRCYSEAEQLLLFDGWRARDAYAFIINRIGERIIAASLNNFKDIVKIISPILEELSVRDVIEGLVSARTELHTLQLRKWAAIERDVFMTVAFDAHPVPVFPVNSNERRTSFVLNRKCNLHCPSCCQKGDTSKHLDDETVFKNFDKALTKAENCGQPIYVSILGGEPTIWSDALIAKIADRLKGYKAFDILTNGTNRKSLWYSVPNAHFLTHVTDWETNMKSYEYESKNDTPLIIITHQTLPLLEDYLKVNKCKSLDITPATDCGDMSITDKDLDEIERLARKYNVPKRWTIGKDRFVKGSNAPFCNKADVVWQFDCVNNTAVTCCKSGGKGYVMLNDWSPSVEPDCSDCTVGL